MNDGCMSSLLLGIVWTGAKAAGLLRGAYHFFRCNVDAKKQADYFIDFVKAAKDDGELPPVLLSFTIIRSH